MFHEFSQEALDIFAAMTNYRLPPFLKLGDTIAIVSTARHIEESKVEAAIMLFESWGLKVLLGNNLHAKHGQFAGTDEQRLSDLQWAIDAQDVNAVVCSRGGYGTVRILDKINWQNFEKHPKWIVGYSDITALHLDILAQQHVCTIHGTMPISIPTEHSEGDSRSVESLQKALFGDNISYALGNHRLNIKGDAFGPVLGGNLSMVYSLLGSKSIPDWAGSILFLEDLDEYLYHVDRMMMNIKRNGILEKVSAIVVGGMTDMNDNAVPYGKSAEEIIHEHCADLGVPLYFGFPAGHQSPNLSLVMGAPCKIEKDELIFTLTGLQVDERI